LDATWQDAATCVICGAIAGLLIGITAEYYTSNSFKPVLELVRRTDTTVRQLQRVLHYLTPHQNRPSSALYRRTIPIPHTSSPVTRACPWIGACRACLSTPCQCRTTG
jgi:hypothetical protein